MTASWHWDKSGTVTGSAATNKKKNGRSVWERASASTRLWRALEALGSMV